MPIVASQPALSTAAAKIVTAPGTLADKVTVVIKGASATIAIGGIGVTFAAGLQLGTADSISLDLGPGDDLYAIASAGTPTIQLLVTRQ